MKKIKKYSAPLICFAFLAVATVAACITGCTTSQQATAFNAAGATDAGVRTAMVGWGAYVSVVHPSSNVEITVRNSFNTYKSAELAVIDATEAVSTNSAATNFLSAAVIAEQAAQADLLTIIASYTNSLTH